MCIRLLPLNGVFGDITRKLMIMTADTRILRALPGLIAFSVFCAAPLLAEGDRFGDVLERIQSLPPDVRGAEVDRFLAGRRTPFVELDTLLTFVWYGRADSVLMSGSLQEGWGQPVLMKKMRCGSGPDSPSLFYLTYTVPRDARLEYKFIVDGEWVIDPRNVRTTPNGDFNNSQAVMPGFVPSRWPVFRDDVPHGTLDTLDFDPHDPEIHSRRVTVYLPPGFGQKDTLPFLIALDGEAALRYMFFPNILDNMLFEGQLPPIVAVFVPPAERNEEYMDLKQADFIDALADELVPLITRRYHAALSPSERGIAGISNGGHAALMAGLARNDVFGLCAGQSSTMSGALDQVAGLRARYAPLPDSFRLYLECGRYDIVSGPYDFPVLNRAFSRRLTACDIRHVYREQAGGHDWPSWRETLPDLLRYFFAHGDSPPDVLPGATGKPAGH